MTAYYNEHDPFAAAWLRELIRDGLIAPGEVDERSIEDVTPDELRPFRQCHFFAGIGVWSLAARLAGFDDDAPLWSGSCPCQPFSAAGQGGGFADERHLWPAFHYLIEQCRPPLVVGEQVAGADGDLWLDLVSADMDSTGYAFGAAETVAAGFGAPHKRTRNYWLGVSTSARLAGQGSAERGLIGTNGQIAPFGAARQLADSDRNGQRAAGDARRDEPERHAQSRGTVSELDDALGDGRGARRDDHGEHERDEPNATGEHGARGMDNAASTRQLAARGGEPREVENDRGIGRGLSRMGRGLDDHGRPGAVNGWWRDADWLRCRDEKWRAVEPASFPLADAGTFRNRVGLLRGAGNAITIGQAEAFLVAVRHALKLG